jgi:hypothetical protein
MEFGYLSIMMAVRTLKYRTEFPYLRELRVDSALWALCHHRHRGIFEEMDINIAHGSGKRSALVTSNTHSLIRNSETIPWN